METFDEEKTQKKDDKEAKHTQLKRDGEEIRNAAMHGLTPSPKRLKKGHVIILSIYFT